MSVFFCGTSFEVKFITYKSNGSWSLPVNLEGIATSAPAVCSWGRNRLSLFVRGTDMQIH
jgi:hypothetical protein